MNNGTDCCANPTSLPLMVFIAAGLFFSSPSTAQLIGWFNPNWTKRTLITIDNPTATSLRDFQVQLSLDGSFPYSLSNADGSDIRVTADDGITSIPFWLETWDPDNASARLWINVPFIPPAGVTIYLYSGNPKALSVSSGGNTFDFFDDFEDVTASQNGYYSLSTPSTALVQSDPWETSAPHTLSVIQTNSADYNYSGYYGLEAGCGAIGLAFSNDLVNWTKYGHNPLMVDGRWPVVTRIGSAFYMIYTKDFCTTSYTMLATSSDGIHFTDLKPLVLAQPGLRNQGAWLFQNPVDGLYYMYWYRGDDSTVWNVMARSSPTIEGLDDASTETTVLRSARTLAATSVVYYDNTYFMATEMRDSFGNWMTSVYASATSPVSGFQLLPDSPILGDGAACLFQYVVGTVLHGYYCKVTNTGWTLEHRSADLTLRNLSFDPAKWNSSGGAWQLIQDTQQDGTSGRVLQGTSLTYNQMLRSLSSGTDYVLEAFGEQIEGREWGLGVRVNDPGDLYTAHLYDDLNGSNNLYAYKWVTKLGTTTATQLGSAIVGDVYSNAWYKMTIKAHGGEMDVYKDDILAFIAADTEFAAGAVALYGEPQSLIEWNNVLVRKYTPVDPRATIGETTEREVLRRR
jgi:hypothetical protein